MGETFDEQIEEFEEFEEFEMINEDIDAILRSIDKQVDAELWDEEVSEEGCGKEKN